ncbi:hypothetical protein [Rhizobium sp. Root1220]|uniref:hypothetical protein n=1 Tax=Rhizobium sp. Root1220 TaxID=1736432 RepID=UPI0006FE1BE9|nr:hypothetical protein [Rhizobium sp. Root1220]KQV82690.1 hypothetical protein ASC90_22820 [Rhizobium sp. Root1220]
MADGPSNVFEMYKEAGGPGFWIRRTTWGNTVARVVGAGAFTAAPPYFGNPSMLMDVYGHDGAPKDVLAAVPAPGTYKTWRSVSPPDWAAFADLRPLDDPRIATAIEDLDRRRGKSRR